MKRFLLLSLAFIALPAAEMTPKPSMATLEGLPAELKQLVLLHTSSGPHGVLNIPALAKGLTTLAATSKTLHAAVNNPSNLLIILKSLPRAGAVVLANGLRNMPGIKSKEVQDWLKSFKLENGEILWRAAVQIGPDGNYMRPDTAQIKSLLANPNINVNMRQKYGAQKTLLMEASNIGIPAITRLLLNAGADVNLQDRHEGTALIFASKNGETQIVKLLLAAGANVDVKDYEHHTALMYARRNRHRAIVKLLEAAEKAQKERAARK